MLAHGLGPHAKERCTACPFRTRCPAKPWAVVGILPTRWRPRDGAHGDGAQNA